MSDDPFLTFKTVFPRQLPGGAARVLHLYRQMQAFARYAPEQQDSILAGQLNHLIWHAKQRSPFWGERLKDWMPGAQNCAETMRGIPMLTRNDLQTGSTLLRAAFPEREALGIMTNSSSGSTGTPVSFEVSPRLFGSLYQAVTLLAAEWHGFDPKKSLGVLGSNRTDKPNAPLGTPFAWFGPVGIGFEYSTKQREIPELYELCAKAKPAYLQCGAQLLKRIADYALKQNRREFQFETALTYGSAVTDEIRDAVRDGLGAAIMDRYSSEETGYIAMQCPKHRHYHVVSPVTYVEIVDKAGNPCAIGERGRVLLTSTQSYGMPLIRYDIGDMAEWGPPCDCGITLPVMSKLWGRIRQNIVTPDGLETYARIYARDFADIKGLLEYRFVLHRNEIVDAQVKVVPETPAIDVAVTQRVQKALRYPYPVRLRYVDEIDWGPSWKQENFAVSDAPPPS